MRLLTSFIMLIVFAATMSTLVFENLSLARQGDLDARFVVFAAAAAGAAAMALLGRMFVKMSSSRESKVRP